MYRPNERKCPSCKRAKDMTLAERKAFNGPKYDPIEDKEPFAELSPKHPAYDPDNAEIKSIMAERAKRKAAAEGKGKSK